MFKPNLFFFPISVISPNIASEQVVASQGSGSQSAVAPERITLDWTTLEKSLQVPNIALNSRDIFYYINSSQTLKSKYDSLTPIFRGTTNVLSRKYIDLEVLVEETVRRIFLNDPFSNPLEQVLQTIQDFSNSNNWTPDNRINQPNVKLGENDMDLTPLMSSLNHLGTQTKFSTLKSQLINLSSKVKKLVDLGLEIPSGITVNNAIEQWWNQIVTKYTQNSINPGSFDLPFLLDSEFIVHPTLNTENLEYKILNIIFPYSDKGTLVSAIVSKAQGVVLEEKRKIATSNINVAKLEADVEKAFAQWEAQNQIENIVDAFLISHDWDELITNLGSGTTSTDVIRNVYTNSLEDLKRKISQLHIADVISYYGPTETTYKMTHDLNFLNEVIPGIDQIVSEYNLDISAFFHPTDITPNTQNPSIASSNFQINVEYRDPSSSNVLQIGSIIHESDLNYITDPKKVLALDYSPEYAKTFFSNYLDSAVIRYPSSDVFSTYEFEIDFANLQSISSQGNLKNSSSIQALFEKWFANSEPFINGFKQTSALTDFSFYWEKSKEDGINTYYTIHFSYTINGETILKENVIGPIKTWTDNTAALQQKIIDLFDVNKPASNNIFKILGESISESFFFDPVTGLFSTNNLEDFLDLVNLNLDQKSELLKLNEGLDSTISFSWDLNNPNSVHDVEVVLLNKKNGVRTTFEIPIIEVYTIVDRIADDITKEPLSMLFSSSVEEWTRTGENISKYLLLNSDSFKYISETDLPFISQIIIDPQHLFFTRDSSVYLLITITDPTNPSNTKTISMQYPLSTFKNFADEVASKIYDWKMVFEHSRLGIHFIQEKAYQGASFTIQELSNFMPIIEQYYQKITNPILGKHRITSIKIGIPESHMTSPPTYSLLFTINPFNSNVEPIEVKWELKVNIATVEEYEQARTQVEDKYHEILNIDYSLAIPTSVDANSKLGEIIEMASIDTKPIAGIAATMIAIKTHEVVEFFEQDLKNGVFEKEELDEMVKEAKSKIDSLLASAKMALQDDEFLAKIKSSPVSEWEKLFEDAVQEKMEMLDKIDLDKWQDLLKMGLTPEQIKNLMKNLDKTHLSKALKVLKKAEVSQKWSLTALAGSLALGGLASGAGSIKMITTVSKLNKMNNPTIKIRRPKRLVMLTSSISVLAIASSVALLIHVFVLKGGL